VRSPSTPKTWASIDSRSLCLVHLLPGDCNGRCSWQIPAGHTACAQSQLLLADPRRAQDISISPVVDLVMLQKAFGVQAVPVPYCTDSLAPYPYLHRQAWIEGFIRRLLGIDPLPLNAFCIGSPTPSQTPTRLSASVRASSAPAQETRRDALAREDRSDLPPLVSGFCPIAVTARPLRLGPPRTFLVILRQSAANGISAGNYLITLNCN